MEELRREIDRLTAELEAGCPLPGTTAHAALVLLQKLGAAAGRTDNPCALDGRAAVLHRFWLESVSWCSQLSRDIERILILQEELSAGE